MKTKVDEIIWKAYAEQSSVGHDVIVILPSTNTNAPPTFGASQLAAPQSTSVVPRHFTFGASQLISGNVVPASGLGSTLNTADTDTNRLYALGSILKARAPVLVDLMNTEVFPSVIDLSTSELTASALKATLDYVHGALDTEPHRLELVRDYSTLCSMLNAAHYCGAESFQLWIETALIEDHIYNIDANDLRNLTEDARAKNANVLYVAASRELARRAPVDVLRSVSSDVLAEIIQSQVQKKDVQGEIIIAGASGKIVSCDLKSGSFLQSIQGDINSVCWSVAISSGGARMLASTCDNSKVQLWNPDNFDQVVHIFEGHTDTVWTVAFSQPAGALLASASQDCSVKIWNTSKGTCVKTLIDHTGGVGSVCFSPEKNLSSTLISGSADTTCRVYDTANWTLVYTLSGHAGSINCLGYSPNAATIVSTGNTDNLMKLWSFDECLRTFTGDSPFTCVAFTPDGATLASSSLSDASIKLWCPVSGTLLQVITEPSSAVYSIAFADDGTLVSVASDSSILVWDLALSISRLAFKVEGLDMAGIVHGFRPGKFLALRLNNESSR